MTKPKREKCPYDDPTCRPWDDNGYYYPCRRCYDDEGRPPMECQECMYGDTPIFAPDWGWVHSPDGAPMPMPCPDKIA
jgi:hypothetical protein